MRTNELKELKALLDLKLSSYNHTDFIKEDPIAIPHKFQQKRDIEIIGLLIATIAWGIEKVF